MSSPATTDSRRPSPPLNYLVLLFPGFQLLDLTGPLDMLNLLSTIPESGLSDLNLTIVASTLDPVPTKPIPPKSKAWTYLPDDISNPTSPAESKNEKTTINQSFNQYILPDTTFTEYLSILQSPDPNIRNKLAPIDVVFIPGGIGTRIHRLYPDPQSSDPKTFKEPISNVSDLQSFLLKIHEFINHSIITVCTGSDVLAQTGLLNHRRATSNMTRWDYVTSRSKDVKWLKWTRWVRSLPDEVSVHVSSASEDLERVSPRFKGEIWSSAGISAGIDVMLAFVAETSGLDIARLAARKLEYEWRELGEGIVDSFYESWREGEGQ